MKNLMFLLVLTMASGLGGESVALSNHAAATRSPRARFSARPRVRIWHRTSAQRARLKRIMATKKDCFAPVRTNEVEVKRLKLMFLLMMSLGPYRTPVH